MSEATSARKQAVRKLATKAPTEKRADTQRKLLEAGRVVIAERGIGRTSIGQICQEAGFTRGAFYSNFTDLDHFVEQVARTEWESTVSGLATALKDTLDPEKVRGEDLLTRVTHLSDAVLEAVPRTRQFHLLWAELANFAIRYPDDTQRLREAILGLRHDLTDYVIGVLGSLGIEPLVPATDVVDMILGIGSRSARNRLLGDQASDGKELVDRLLPLMMPALSKPKDD